MSNSGEDRARLIAQRVLNKSVVVNDDGSAPSMYDLRVGPRNSPEIAIECVGAVDPQYTETWNIGPAKGPVSLAIDGDWTIEIAANSRVKAIHKKLQHILEWFEARNIYDVPVNFRLRRLDESIFSKMNSIGIKHAICYRKRGSGLVDLTMSSGGIIHERGNEIPNWIGQFLRDSAQKDVLYKLQWSGSIECHVFILTSAHGTPWEVDSYLMSEFKYVPDSAPDLPAPVTAVWLISWFRGKGLYWDGTRWAIIDTHIANTEL